MASEMVWMLTALIILATVCFGVFKGILGDTLQYARGSRAFLLHRLARYGDPFTISLMGKTYTVVNSPETIKFVLSTTSASFPDVYPVQYRRLLSAERLTGKKNVQFRKMILSAASGEGLQKLVPFISSLAEKTVKSWENRAVVDSAEEAQKFAWTAGMHISWKNVEAGPEEMNQMRKEIFLVGDGLVSLPINLPGFTFHKAMKAREALVSRIQSEISRRRTAGVQQDDILNALMSIGEDEFPDYEICGVMVGLMFASSVTSAALIPWVLKYLADFPEVRQRVQEEQDGLRQKMIEDKSLAWFKPRRSMPYTLQIIFEIMRVESISPVAPRHAKEDVDYNGLVFRKGSYVWPSTTSLHYDPKYHSNPSEFDPSRFVDKPNPNAFLPFGQGPHLCPGSELALTETMFIIHHLVSNYSWKSCGLEERIVELPIRKFVSSPICLVKRHMT